MKLSDIEKFSRSLGTQISLAARRMKSALEKELASDGLTPSQWMLLMALGEKDHQVQTELGKMVHLDNATITRSLDKLQDMNLILRKQDEGDRRVQHVILTKKGYEAYRQWNALGKKVNESATKNLSREEIEKLLKWLGVIIVTLNTTYNEEK